LFNIEHFHIQIVPKIGWSVIWLQMKQWNRKYTKVY
jgi:hypothetical protein